MSKSLATIPPELLSQIVSHLETARTLLYLSLTCKRLHEYVERDGFRVFVQNRFPSILTPPFWKDAAHALTALSRNWDRKALIARCIAPDIADLGDSVRSKYGKISRSQPRRRAQTMGYQPVIDSYIDWYGSDWNSRKEILAWGGGPDLVVRVKSMGDKAEKEYQPSHGRGKKTKLFDQHQHMNEWMVHREASLVEGRDDITSVNLLRPSQNPTSGSEYIVVGRASGYIEVVKVSMAESESHKVAELVSGKTFRSASLNSSPTPLVAACLVDSTISFHSIHLAQNLLQPLGEICAIPPGESGRTWSTQFLRHDRLAVGLGPSKQPLHVYSLRQDRVSTELVRKLEFPSPSADNRMDTTGGAACGISTVYSIAPIAPSSLAGGAEGDLFLTGSYDGAIRYVLARVDIDSLLNVYCRKPQQPLQGKLMNDHRLHDLRSPYHTMASFTDLVDTFSAIYSIIPFGQERFVAGGARHSILKVFDLRMPGGKLYHAAKLDPCSSTISPSHPKAAPPTPKSTCCNYHYKALNHLDWNIFLRLQSNKNINQVSDSPVYSLSSPSPFSPSWYAGVEDNVLQVDMISMMDQHPDPVFKYGPTETGNKDLDVIQKWNPQQDALCLPAYEQKPGGNVPLVKQQRVGKVCGIREDWDERWQ